MVHYKPSIWGTPIYGNPHIEPPQESQKSSKIWILHFSFISSQQKTLKLRYVHFMFIDNGAPDLALDFPKMASKKDKSCFSNAAKQTLIHTYSYYSIFYSIHECGFYPISNKTHMESRYVLPDRVRSIINVSFSLLFLAG